MRSLAESIVVLPSRATTQRLVTHIQTAIQTFPAALLASTSTDLRLTDTHPVELAL
jgi:hypothetical protein